MKKVWREVSFRWFSAIVEGGECGGNLEEEEEMSKLGGFLAKPNFPLRILSFLFNWNPLDREINKPRKESNRIQFRATIDKNRSDLAEEILATTWSTIRSSNYAKIILYIIKQVENIFGRERKQNKEEKER